MIDQSSRFRFTNEMNKLLKNSRLYRHNTPGASFWPNLDLLCTSQRFASLHRPVLSIPSVKFANFWHVLLVVH